MAVVNFPPKQIGPFMSEVLTLGVPDGDGDVVLLVPEQDVPHRRADVLNAIASTASHDAASALLDGADRRGRRGRSTAP